MTMNEVAEKYGLAPLETFKEEFDEIGFYESFLRQTDHIPNKIIEALIEDLAAATITNFVKVFIDFIVSVRLEYKDVLECRKFARDEINRLEAGE